MTHNLISRKWNFLYCLFIVMVLVPVLTFGEDIKLKFDPPDGTEFYESTKLSQVRKLFGELEKSDVEIQSYNVIKKSTDGYTGTSKLINIQFYINDKRIKFPFIETLTEMTETISIDTLGKIKDVKGLEGWDKFLKANTNPKYFDIVRSIFGADAIKRYIIKASTEDKEYYVLPFGARIPLPATVKPVEKVKTNGKDCIRVGFTYDTKIKSLSWDPGPLYQEFRKKQGLEPLNIDYSNIKVKGKGDMVVDPQTSLDYGGQMNRVIQVSIDVPGQGKVPIVIQEHYEISFDYPEKVALLHY